MPTSCSSPSACFFVFQGLALVNWSGELRGYSFLSTACPCSARRSRLNRLLAFLGACVLAMALFLVLRYTRFGSALRAITIDPVAASLVGVDVRKFSALAFAAGGALAAVSGMLVSTFISFTAAIGVEYTLKALIVVIMAGVGRVTGTLAAGLLLGVVESVGGYLLDPALTIAINFGLFMLVLLLAPDGVVHPCLSCCTRNSRIVALMALATVALALLPLFASGYVVSLFIVLYANVALATAWAFFSGTTRYISLATAAFFGVGIYALAILHVHVPIPWPCSAPRSSASSSPSSWAFRRCGCAASISWSSRSASPSSCIRCSTGGRSRSTGR